MADEETLALSKEAEGQQKGSRCREGSMMLARVHQAIQSMDQGKVTCVVLQRADGQIRESSYSGPQQPINLINGSNRDTV